MSENTGTVRPPDTGGVPPIPAERRMARRRRPTGAPPPLPHPVSVTTTAWLILGGRGARRRVPSVRAHAVAPD